ncbi:arginine deiminase family protein [Sandaracinobacter neustonicus]|nr:arginine deiminase family protein [Sandaracinobacter neustonicus]
MRVFDFNRAIARTPGETVIHGLRAGDQPDPSFEGVLREHAAYLAALRSAGVEVTLLPALPEFPDSMFVEDPALVFPEGAILLRPGAPSREHEAAHLAPELNSHFAEVLDLPEGHADGGDVLLTPGGRVFIGLSARTDAAGAAALIRQLDRLGYKGEIAHTPPGTLHLKTASSLIDEETILATEALAASGVFNGFRVLTVPAGEEGGANVLRANAHLLTGNRYPRTLEMLDRFGAKLIPLEVEQISRIDAGLTCMSLRWWAGV